MSRGTIEILSISDLRLAFCMRRVRVTVFHISPFTWTIPGNLGRRSGDALPLFEIDSPWSWNDVDSGGWGWTRWQTREIAWFRGCPRFRGSVERPVLRTRRAPIIHRQILWWHENTHTEQRPLLGRTKGSPGLTPSESSPHLPLRRSSRSSLCSWIPLSPSASSCRLQLCPVSVPCTRGRRATASLYFRLHVNECVFRLKRPVDDGPQG